MLEDKGYPFKSKLHSKWVGMYQRNGMSWSIKNYIGEGDKVLYRGCPKILKYQFVEDFDLKISDKCCDELKEKPVKKWAKENQKSININGIMRAEGGRRNRANCLSFRDGKLRAFQPLAPLTSEWEDWYIEKFNVGLCELYYPPYNLERTGCKGCPFALHLQDELDMLEQYFPNERKQCEIIWKPVYEEYRRLGYRLNKEDRSNE